MNRNIYKRYPYKPSNISTNNNHYQNKQNNNTTIGDEILGVQKINKMSSSDFNHKLNMYENRYRKETAELNQKSIYTNTPYKPIHGNETFKKPVKTAEDLIIYKDDKVKNSNRLIEKRITETINDRKTYDFELSKTYNRNNYNNHKKSFVNEINNRFNTPVNTANNEDFKKDSYKFHEQQQKEFERNRINVDQIINELVDINNPLF